MENFKKFVKQLDDATESAKNNSGENYIRFKDDQKELHDWFFEAVIKNLDGGFDQIEEVYTALATLPEIVEYSEDFDQLEDNINEYEWSDIYNADLLDWVKKDLSRIADVDESIQAGTHELIGAIIWAQHHSRVELARAIVEAVKEKVAAQNE